MVTSRWLRAIVVLAVLVALAQAAVAQDIFARKEIVLYEGNPLEQSGIRLGPWGSGWAEEASQNPYSGSRSIKIMPNDLYTGGRIDFETPVDITKQMNDPEVYLQFVSRFWGMKSDDDPLIAGMPGSTDIYGGTQNPGRQVRTLRMVMYFDNGQAVESQVALNSFRVGNEGWMAVSFPMSFLKDQVDLPSYRVRRIVLSGDGDESFYIGEIRAIRCTVPLTADAGGDKEIARNYMIAFQGFSTSGATAVKYSWDFDASDGIQEEAVGDLVYRRFTKAGTYTVTLTVSDSYGIKKPASTTIQVKVNE